MIIPTNEDIAAFASLAMTLEASSYPKPGNVHRTKDFEETSFEHFLASAAAVYPVYSKAANETIGSLFYEAILQSRRIQCGGNTHFGTFALLIPLVKATNCLNVNSANLNPDKQDETKEKKNGKKIIEKAFEICRRTTSEDAVRFYEAFQLLPVYVNTTKPESKESEYDLTDPASAEAIMKNGVTLFDLMKMSAKKDMVAAEWANGFEKSYLFARRLQENIYYFEENPGHRYKSVINSAVTLTFLEFMAAFQDSFIAAKFDVKTAEQIRQKAGRVLFRSNSGVTSKNLKKHIPKIKKMDKKMQKEKINPGSMADIAAAGIFIALLEGMTF